MHCPERPTTEEQDLQNEQRRCVVHTTVLFGAAAVWVFNAYGFAVSLLT